MSNKTPDMPNFITLIYFLFVAHCRLLKGRLFLWICRRAGAAGDAALQHDDLIAANAARRTRELSGWFVGGALPIIRR